MRPSAYTRAATKGALRNLLQSGLAWVALSPLKGDLSVPPLRDLPPGRLAQRREHLLFEITRKRDSREALVPPWPSRSGRPGRRRLLVVAVAAIVAVVGTAAAIGSVRDFILDRGFIGLPPEGATPSAPESGELVLRWFGSTASLIVCILSPSCPMSGSSSRKRARARERRERTVPTGIPSAIAASS
jgi:hypothetical protein